MDKGFPLHTHEGMPLKTFREEFIVVVYYKDYAPNPNLANTTEIKWSILKNMNSFTKVTVNFKKQKARTKRRKPYEKWRME